LNAHHAQYVDVRQGTLDICSDEHGLSLAIVTDSADGFVKTTSGDIAVPACEIPALIGTIIAGPEDEPMPDRVARFGAMFTPPPAPCGKCDGTGRFEYDETAPGTGPCDECGETGKSGDLSLLDADYDIPWLALAYLHRLDQARDFEAWAETDCDDMDGILRELIDVAFRLRAKLVDGIPDHPDMRDPQRQAMLAAELAEWNAQEGTPR
jgi:hypothetical protein